MRIIAIKGQEKSNGRRRRIPLEERILPDKRAFPHGTESGGGPPDPPEIFNREERYSVRISDEITAYILHMLENADDGEAELRRNELAEELGCVPSQINYVLETRFNPEAGYYIETRRGGGGYIKIMKLDFDSDENLANMLNESKAKAISQKAGENFIQRLYSEDLLTKREAVILKGLMIKNMFGLPDEEADYMRGKIIRLVLVTLLRDDLT